MCEADRSRVRAAVAASRPDDEDLEGAVVTKFVAVTEWMAPDGTRWLTLLDGDAADEPLYRWDVQGMFHNVLHDPAWQEDPGEADD